MKDFLISPPFGSYVGHRSANSVLGTFTLSARHGRTGKILQFALDNFRHPVVDGWRNRIGLRNPGVGALADLNPEYIYSVAAIEQYDWMALLYMLGARGYVRGERSGRVTIELNFGCQNVEAQPIPKRALERFCIEYDTIAKLPAEISAALALAEQCAASGIGFFHCGNTVKDDIGSLSGYPAKVVNLPICEEIAKRYPHIPIIGGGGIYTYQDLLDYQDAGARHFSLATVWFRPWRALNIIHQHEGKYALRDPAESPA